MKVEALMTAGIIVILLASSAGGQEKKRDKASRSNNKPSNADMRQSHSPPRELGPAGVAEKNQIVNTAGGLSLPADDSGIGICLIGEQYEFFTDPLETDKCDAMMWIDAVTWLINQRKLIDQSILVGESSTSEDGAVSCRSCSGTCQVVALPVKDSYYEDVAADGGLSPGECLATIKAICESGSYRYFANARCGN